MTVPFLTVKPKSIKLKVSPRFPAQVIGRTGIDVNKTNGNYYFDLDYAAFPKLSTLTPGTYVAQFNPTSGQFSVALSTSFYNSVTGGSIKDFGAVGDGLTDDSAAIQAFFSWLAGASVSNPRAGTMPAGIYLTSQALTLDGSYCTIATVDREAVVIRYIGASTTTDIITIGNGTTQRVRVNIGSIYVDSTTTMTAGAAVHVNNVVESEIDFSAAGQARYGAVGNKLWHGIWFDKVDNVVWGGKEIFVQRDGLRVNGAVGAGAKADLFVREGCKIGFCAIGVHVAGAFGGFYFNSGDIAGNTTNFRVSNDISAEGNREIFIGPGVTFDSSHGGHNAQLADTLASASLWIQFSGTWISGTDGSTDCVSIESGHQGLVVFNGGTIYKSARDGIRNNSTSSIVIANGVAFRQNTGIAFNNTVSNSNVYARHSYFTTNGTNLSGTVIIDRAGVTDASDALVGNAGQISLGGLNGSSGTFTATITIAAPAVITGTHNFNGVHPVKFSTTGALPTGITAGTTYYTCVGTTAGNAFNIATSVANAIANTAITTTGTQSGTQTGDPSFVATTATVYNGAAVLLTPGDWDISAVCELSVANTTTVSSQTDFSLSSNAGTRNTIVGQITRAPVFTGAGDNFDLSVGPVRASISANTWYYAVLRTTFGTSTLTVLGTSIRARRVR